MCAYKANVRLFPGAILFRQEGQLDIKKKYKNTYENIYTVYTHKRKFNILPYCQTRQTVDGDSQQPCTGDPGPPPAWRLLSLVRPH